MKSVLLTGNITNYKTDVSRGLIKFLSQCKDNNIDVYTEILPNDDIESLLKIEQIILLPKNDRIDYTDIISESGGKLCFRNEYFGNYDELSVFLFTNKRIAEVTRKTKETDITVKLDLDGSGKNNINTGIGFFDHMLEQISRHANIDLDIKVNGDLHIDEHHSVEDTGITLGEAIKKALGNKSGIKRYGYFIPMDESKSYCLIDLGGRPYLDFNCKFKREKIGEFPTELTEEFFRGLTNSMNANIHIKCKGKNDHHKTEAIFKSFSKALNEALRIDERVKGLPSTKGVL